MISASSSKISRLRTFASLTLVALASVASGCDSSSTHTTPPVEKVLDKELPPEKLEKWVGEGATKHKEAISREERLKLIKEMSKKPG